MVHRRVGCGEGGEKSIDGTIPFYVSSWYGSAYHKLPGVLVLEYGMSSYLIPQFGPFGFSQVLQMMNAVVGAVKDKSQQVGWR